jgi:hypothetical protein
LIAIILLNRIAIAALSDDVIGWRVARAQRL